MNFYIRKQSKLLLIVFILFNFEILMFPENSIKIPMEFESHFISNFTKAIQVSYPENFVKYGFDGEEQLWFVDLSRGKDVKRFFYK